MASVVSNLFKDLITDILDGTTGVPSTYYVGSGTGAGTAASGDTTLFTEVAEARVATTNSQPISTTNRFVATQTYANSQTITNAGLFNAATVGTLLIKGDFAGILVDIGDSIVFTFDLQKS